MEIVRQYTQKPLTSPTGYNTKSYFITINSNKNTDEGRDAIDTLQYAMADILEPSIEIQNPVTNAYDLQRNDANTLDVHVRVRRETAKDGRFHMHVSINIITINPFKAMLNYTTFRELANRAVGFHEGEGKLYINFRTYVNNDLRIALYMDKQYEEGAANIDQIEFNLD